MPANSKSNNSIKMDEIMYKMLYSLSHSGYNKFKKLSNPCFSYEGTKWGGPSDETETRGPGATSLT
jgi:hypothetical protein